MPPSPPAVSQRRRPFWYLWIVLITVGTLVFVMGALNPSFFDPWRVRERRGKRTRSSIDDAIDAGGNNTDLFDVARQERHRRRLSWFGKPPNDATADTDAARPIDDSLGVLRFRRPLRMLWLSFRRAIDDMTDRHHFDFFAAVKRHEWVQAELWGEGFEGWRDGLSVQENIAGRFGSPTHFDLVNVWPQTYNLHDSPDLLAHSVIAYQEHECWHRMCEHWADGIGGANIFMTTVAYELLQFQNDYKQRVWLHSPTGFDPSRFYRKADEEEERDIDLLVIGAVVCDPPIYPLRARMARLIADKKIKRGDLNALHVQHPGYFLGKSGNVPPWAEGARGAAPDVSAPGAPSYEEQAARYVSLLHRAKIVVGDASVFKYGLQKLTEIPAAGALLLTDMPAERQPSFSQFIVEAPEEGVDGDKDDALVRMVEHWLDHNDEREKRAKRGQYIALSQMTFDDDVDGLIHAFVDYKLKRRFGLKFWHPFSMGCSVTGRQPKESCNYERSGWCDAKPLEKPPKP